MMVRDGCWRVRYGVWTGVAGGVDGGVRMEDGGARYGVWTGLDWACGWKMQGCETGVDGGVDGRCRAADGGPGLVPSMRRCGVRRLVEMKMGGSRVDVGGQRECVKNGAGQFSPCFVVG